MFYKILALESLFCVCNTAVGNAHQCVICKNYVHVFCGEPVDSDDEGYGQKLNCSCCLKQEGSFSYVYLKLKI